MSTTAGSAENSLVSVESGDFIFVQNKNAKKDVEIQGQLFENMDDDMDLRGLNPDELKVVHNIKKLVKENEVLKNSLQKHNGLIQEYCNELENLQNQQNNDKEATLKTIENLQSENKQLKALIECQTFNASSQANSLSELEIKTHIMPILVEITKNVKKVYKINESMEKSIGYPIQESQTILASISEGFAMLQHSIQDHITDRNVYTVCEDWRISSSQESVISDLKAELSEKIENLNALTPKFSEMQELNEKLQTENEKCKKFIRQQQQKIEQLECEQPSVEIMQIASPQQTRIIDGLKKEIESKNDEVKKLQDEKQNYEEKFDALNLAHMRKSQENSLQIKADGEEISKIRLSYEMAIEGLKDEIAAEKQRNVELSDSFKNREPDDGSKKEITLLNRTIEMMRKRENKDMDKMNTLVIERNTYKKDCDEKLQIIQELKAQLSTIEQVADKKDKRSSAEEEQFEVISKQSHSLEQESLIEEMKTKAKADEEVVTEMKKRISELESELEERTQHDVSVYQLEEDNKLLTQQKSDLLDKFEDLSKMQERLEHEQDVNESLSKELRDFTVNAETMRKDMHNYTRQQIADKESIRDLKLKVAKYNEQLTAGQEEMNDFKKAFDEYRQRNKVLETNLGRTEKEYKSVLNNLQVKNQQLAKAEEQLKYFSDLKVGLSVKVKNLEEMCKNFEKQLSARDAYIRKMNEEVETIAILKEQVRVYEADFNIEREAREKQHSDILILRDEVHHLKLENHRLREESETMQRHQMAELQNRYGVGGSSFGTTGMSQDLSNGLYFRGSVARDNRNEEQYKSSVEAAPQEPDQNVQRLCPKCHAPFPDLDTLQIHVLECLDE